MHALLAQLARRRTLRVAGLMSGTSADGIDVAIIDLTGSGVRVLAFETMPYPPAVRRALFRLFDSGQGRVGDLRHCRSQISHLKKPRSPVSDVSRQSEARPPVSGTGPQSEVHPPVSEICHLNFLIGELFAEALIGVARMHHIPLETIHLIGSHGQTICHLPAGRRVGGRLIRSTLQIGEPSVIAERTGITTVADFRPRDIAAGGQGAPLVPYADHLLFGHPTKHRAVQNIGGIANVTWLPAGGGIDRILAFDTGPGNMIIDRMAQRLTGGRQRYDRDGRMAAGGQVNGPLLERLLRHPYFRRRPPKTTGRELFGAAFADRLLDEAERGGLAPADLVATATAFTACTIADAYQRFLPAMPDEVILCGGGSRNPTLVEMLRQENRTRSYFRRLVVMDELGINADEKEAVSFAILARETICGMASNVPSATGARRPVVLGKIIPGRNVAE